MCDCVCVCVWVRVRVRVCVNSACVASLYTHTHTCAHAMKLQLEHEPSGSLPDHTRTHLMGHLVSKLRHQQAHHLQDTWTETRHINAHTSKTAECTNQRTQLPCPQHSSSRVARSALHTYTHTLTGQVRNLPFQDVLCLRRKEPICVEWSRKRDSRVGEVL